MSIATRIENMNDNLKNAYSSLEDLGVNLENTNKNLQNLSSKIDTLYNELPKVTNEGTEITLTPTRKGRMQLDLKGNTEQKQLSGKNLIYPTAELETVTSNGITFTPVYDEDGYLLYINANGTATSDTSYDFISASNRLTLPAGTYLLNGCPNGSQTTYCINFSARNITLLTNYSGDSTMNLSSQDDMWLQIKVKEGTTLSNVQFKPMLRLSTITDDTYEPYCGGQPSPNPEYPQDIHVVTGNNTIEVQGKNLLDWNLFEDNNYTNVVNKTPRILSITGKTSYYTGICIFLNLKPNTQYAIQALVTTVGTNSQGKLVIYNKNYNGSGNLSGDPSSIANRIVASSSLTTEGKVSCTFTTDETGIIYVVFQCNNNTNNGSITYEDIQLEEGQVQTNFEPYYHADYPINLDSFELCKIGDYQDYLYKENGKWYKRQIIKSKRYTNNNNFQLGSASTDNYYIFQTYSGNSTIDDAKINGNSLVCDNFVFHNYEDNLQEEYIAINSNAYSYIRFHIASNRLSEKSVNAFKEWLRTHNVLLYYILENATTTQITDETLISQLDTIEKAKSNEGQTNITQTNADLPFIINATALLKND